MPSCDSKAVAATRKSASTRLRFTQVQHDRGGGDDEGATRHGDEHEQPEALRVQARQVAERTRYVHADGVACDGLDAQNDGRLIGPQPHRAGQAPFAPRRDRQGSKLLRKYCSSRLSIGMASIVAPGRVWNSKRLSGENTMTPLASARNALAWRVHGDKVGEIALDHGGAQEAALFDQGIRKVQAGDLAGAPNRILVAAPAGPRLQKIIAIGVVDADETLGLAGIAGGDAVACRVDNPDRVGIETWRRRTPACC